MMALVEASRQPDCAYEVVLVAADRADAAGIGWAEAQGIATVTHPAKGIAKPDHEALINAALGAASVEVIALAGYMRLLSGAFVARWEGNILNIHPSLLPRHKGLDTHARAIAAGDQEAGATVHIVTEELDGGPILGQAAVPVMPDDTAETLAARVLVAEHQLYPRMLNAFCRQ